MSRVTLFCLTGLLVTPPSAQAAPAPDGALVFRGKSLSQWVKSLAERDPATRAAAVNVLAVVGPEAQFAVPALRSLLRDEDATVRHKAVHALGEIGTAAAGTAEGLREALAHNDEETRQSAVVAARAWGEAGFPILSTALNDGDPKVRAAAAGSLAFRGAKPTKEIIAGLARALADKEHEVRQEAAFALLLIGPAAKEAIPALRKATSDGDHEERVRAAEALAQVGEMKAAVLALAAMVAHDDGTGFAQSKAAFALASLGPMAKDALPALEAAFKSRHTSVRLASASALWQIDRREKMVVPMLVKEIEAPTDLYANVMASLQLGSMGATSIPPLVKLLNSPNHLARTLAAGSLALLGPEGTPALGALTDAVKDSHPDVRRAAIAALLRMGPDGRGLAALAGAVRDEELSVRQDAAFALLSLGHNTDQAVPVFEELLKETDDDDADLIRPARALWKATHRVDVAVKTLLRVLEFDNPLAKEAAAGVLAEMGPGAKAAVPALVAALKHDYDYVRRSALLALVAIGNPPREMLPFAVVALEGDDFEQRVSGALALAALGRRAASAVPALTGRLRDKHPAVRRAAALALKQITPDRDVEVPPFKADDVIARGVSVRECVRWLRSAHPPARGERTALILQILGPEPIVIKELVESLVEPDPEVRDQATTFLCRFGPSAKDAVPLLLPLLKHRHPGTRHAATEALRAIDPETAAKRGVK